MDKITHSLVNSFVSQFELERLDPATQFEHFSNFCVASKLYRGSFELDTVHSGSGGDSSIDGVCIVVNGRLITEEEELKDVVENTGHLDADITFIQSKTSSSFDGAQIGSFIHGVKDFLSDHPNMVQNQKIKKVKSIWEAIISMSSYMVNRRPNCKLHYICTGKWMNDQNLCAIIDSGRNEIDGIGIFEQVAIVPYGASEIQRLYHQTKNKLLATVNFQNRITLPDIEGITEAYLGVIPLNEYLKLIQDENETLHSIFDDNVRDFQGDTPVNKKIKKTLEEGKYDLFCVLNNGVTIVASDLTPAGNRFTIRDYQVVNGCQTSNVLYENQKLEGIEQVYVPVKIIITDDDEVKTRITLATNSQTEVRAEQLEALNVFQRKLELYYHAENEGVKLFYERRSQQYNSNASVKKTQIISIPIQIKSFASVFLNAPHLVSGYYGTIVSRFDGKIFSEEHNCSPYYVSGLCFYRMEQYFRNGEVASEYKKARFHLMLLVRLLAIGEDLAPFNSKKLDKACEKFKNILKDESDSLALFKQAVEILNNSEIDKDKKSYKTQTDKDELIKAYRIHNN
jgi:hypothetical protein